MSSSEASGDNQRGTAAEIEKGLGLRLKFDADGLLPAIVQDAATGEILMFAWMNAAAVEATISTRRAHFWSRSRGRMWVKGEESGNVLDVTQVLVDCDQDVLLVKVQIGGDGVACHTGARSCFYRSIDLSVAGANTRPALKFIEPSSKQG